jgi:hypothetical protein
MDDIAQWLFGLSFVINLVVIAALWRSTRFGTTSRSFWRSLAIGWTLSLAANVIWIGYDIVTGVSLPPLSMVDVLYLARYLFVWLAFWGYPEPLPLRWLRVVVGMMMIVAVIAWLGHYGPVWRSTDIPMADFLGVALYPILDAGLIFTGLVRIYESDRHRVRPSKPWVVFSLLSYGMANWFNFDLRLGLLVATSLWPTLLWMLSDLAVGVSTVAYTTRERRA